MSAPTDEGTTSQAHTSWLRRVLPYVLAVAIVGILVGKVGVGDIVEELSRADVGMIVLATVFSCVTNTVVGADKWRRIVNIMGCAVSFRESLFIRLGGGPIRFSVPAKGGELVKPLYLSKHHGLPFVRGASSLLFDKVLNLWGVLFFLFVGIPFFGVSVPRYAIALPVAFVAGPVALWYWRGTFYRVAGRLHGKLHDLMVELLSAFEIVKPSQLAFLFLYSIVFQATEIITCFLVCLSVGIEPSVPFHKLMVIVPLVIVFSNIPGPISGLGYREAAMLALLSRYAGATSQQAVTAGLLLSATEYILPAAIGIPLLPAFVRSISEGGAVCGSTSGGGSK